MQRSIGATSALLDLGPGLIRHGTDRNGQALAASVDPMVGGDGTVVSHASVLGGSPAVARRRLGAVVPPFRYVLHDRASDTVSAGADGLGLAHIYVAKADGIVLASTSATLLALATATSVDQSALKVYSLLGCFLGEQTLYSGVRKLAAGEHVELNSGKLLFHQQPDSVPVAVREEGFFPDLATAAQAGVEVLDEVFAGYAITHPSPLFELSGGMDSRLLLAFSSRHEWRDRRGLTIGPQASADVQLAVQLAERRDVPLTVVPYAVFGDWDPAATLHRVTTAARHRDFASNGLTGAIFDDVSARTEASAQISGQGGELGRGSYYAGQAERRGVTAQDALRIVQWRLAVNQAAAADVLSASVLEDREAVLRDASWGYVRDLPDVWPGATDQIYLFGRMQRWAGIAYSKWTSDRPRLLPFFHPAYVEWAAQVPVHLKRESRTFVEMMSRVDLELAKTPLTSGLTPQQTVSPSLAGRVRRARRDTRRAARKIGQRLGGGRHAPAGAAQLAATVQSAWRQEWPESLDESGFFDEQALAEVRSGARALDAVTVAFMVNVSQATAMLQAGHPHGAAA
ncbi:hypothetical protein [Euzebya tangerina]|uniref:hypothetical protein n=1 Tax=Euzebya tangerina TaxID=591198 RepID=UPI0013C2B122|nr:hypothetical protein [Euzebya tangerina]